MQALEYLAQTHPEPEATSCNDLEGEPWPRAPEMPQLALEGART